MPTERGVPGFGMAAPGLRTPKSSRKGGWTFTNRRRRRKRFVGTAASRRSAAVWAVPPVSGCGYVS